MVRRWECHLDQTFGGLDMGEANGGEFVGVIRDEYFQIWRIRAWGLVQGEGRAGRLQIAGTVLKNPVFGVLPLIGLSSLDTVPWVLGLKMQSFRRLKQGGWLRNRLQELRIFCRWVSYCSSNWHDRFIMFAFWNGSAFIYNLVALFSFVFRREMFLVELLEFFLLVCAIPVSCIGAFELISWAVLHFLLNNCRWWLTVQNIGTVIASMPMSLCCFKVPKHILDKRQNGLLTLNYLDATGGVFILRLTPLRHFCDDFSFTS